MKLLLEYLAQSPIVTKKFSFAFKNNTRKQKNFLLYHLRKKLFHIEEKCLLKTLWKNSLLLHFFSNTVRNDLNTTINKNSLYNQNLIRIV